MTSRSFKTRLRTVMRGRRVWMAVAATLAVTTGGLLLTGGAPVGHFRSGAAADDFARAYHAAMADLPTPDATLDVRTSYGVVRAYRFDGARPDAAPLVLLPGTSSGAPVFADNIPSLREVRTVWALDLLGEPGMSVQQRPIETHADQATWLAEALARLPADQVHLVGLSIGGRAAMNLVSEQDAAVASVVLIDPVLTFANLSTGAIIRSIPASVPWTPKRWRDSFSSWTAGGAPVEDVPVADMIETGMKTYRTALPTPSRISEEQLADVDVPVLAIIAGNSPMHDAQDAARFARRAMPDARVAVYAGASHAINGEFPDRIAADITSFLDDVEPR